MGVLSALVGSPSEYWLYWVAMGMLAIGFAYRYTFWQIMDKFMAEESTGVLKATSKSSKLVSISLIGLGAVLAVLAPILQPL